MAVFPSSNIVQFEQEVSFSAVRIRVAPLDGPLDGRSRTVAATLIMATQVQPRAERSATSCTLKMPSVRAISKLAAATVQEELLRLDEGLGQWHASRGRGTNSHHSLAEKEQQQPQNGGGPHGS